MQTIERDAEAVLADWTRVVRVLKGLAPNSPDADVLFVEIEILRDEYERLVADRQWVAIGATG